MYTFSNCFCFCHIISLTISIQLLVCTIINSNTKPNIFWHIYFRSSSSRTHFVHLTLCHAFILLNVTHKVKHFFEILSTGLGLLRSPLAHNHYFFHYAHPLCNAVHTVLLPPKLQSSMVEPFGYRMTY